jgi:hypothetical protein
MPSPSVQVWQELLGNRQCVVGEKREEERSCRSKDPLMAELCRAIFKQQFSLKRRSQLQVS